MLVFGELSDRLEGDVGLGGLNIVLSSPVAVLVTCLGALVGDTILTLVEGHSGWRPGPHVATWALMVVGGIAAGWILASHVGRAMRLDAWTALAGGLLLTIAGAGRHQSVLRQPPSTSAPGSRRPALPD